MDMAMLRQFGEIKIAIECEYFDGYLVLNLAPEQILELTGGRLSELKDINADNVQGFFSRSKLTAFLFNNKSQITLIFANRSKILPPYP